MFQKVSRLDCSLHNMIFKIIRHVRYLAPLYPVASKSPSARSCGVFWLGFLPRRDKQGHPGWNQSQAQRKRGNLFTFVTTLPAPMVHPSPIVTPGKIMTFPAIQQSSPTVMGRPLSGPLVPFRKSGSNG